MLYIKTCPVKLANSASIIEIHRVYLIIVASCIISITKQYRATCYVLKPSLKNYLTISASFIKIHQQKSSYKRSERNSTLHFILLEDNAVNSKLFFVPLSLLFFIFFYFYLFLSILFVV